MKKRYLKTCAALCMTIVMAAGSFASVGAAQLSTAKAAVSDAETMDITLNEDEIKQDVQSEEGSLTNQQICDEIMEQYSYWDLRGVRPFDRNFVTIDHVVQTTDVSDAVSVYTWKDTPTEIVTQIQAAYGERVKVKGSSEWLDGEWVLDFEYCQCPDINEDGEFDLQDVQAALNYYLGTTRLNMRQAEKANVSPNYDSDIVVDLQDVQQILENYMEYDELYDVMRHWEDYI